jgi:hypothetical protein
MSSKSVRDNVNGVGIFVRCCCESRFLTDVRDHARNFRLQVAQFVDYYPTRFQGDIKASSTSGVNMAANRRI